MKKTFILFGMCMTITALSYCQSGSNKIRLKMGPQFKESNKYMVDEIIGSDGKGIYVLKTRARGIDMGILSNSNQIAATLERFDLEMNLIKTTELELKHDGKKLDFEFVIQFQNELYLFTSERDGKSKKNILYMQGIDKETMVPESEAEKIADIDYSSHLKWNSGVFAATISPDSSKLLIYYDLPYERNSNEKYGVVAFDKSLKKLWEKEFEIPYIDKKFEITDYTIDNEGNFHVLGKRFMEKDEKVKGEVSYRFHILSYFDGGRSFIEYPIEVPDKYLSEMQIAIDPQTQDIICAGFYSKTSVWAISGSFYLKISKKTKEFIQQNFKEFGLDFMTETMSEKKAVKAEKNANKGKEVEMYKYYLDNIISRKDGSFVLVGEQFDFYTTTTTTTTSNGGTSTHTTNHYIFGDIIVISISKIGEIEWTEKVAKMQRTLNDNGNFSSYTWMEIDGSLFFVFNDNPKNLDYSSGVPEKFNNGKESIVLLVELDREGKETRELLFKASEAETKLRPTISCDLSDRELIIYGQKGKLHRYFTLSF
ncbi:MAG: hypothetical protein KKD31_16250 [Bacteroidetes bacterium]|nr:hypothetical protein [Bacteroidota bacterium]